MNYPINQHFLPQFYLRRFSIGGFPVKDKSKAQIWTYNVKTKKHKTRLIKDVASENHFYSHKDITGKFNYDAELNLSKMESDLALVFSEFSENFIDLNSKSGKNLKEFMSFFIASMMTRNPDSHKMIKSTHDLIKKHIENTTTFMEPIKGLPTYDFSSLNENDLKFNFSNSIFSNAFSLREHLLNKRWTIWCCETPIFVTSYNPVCQFNEDRNIYGIGTKGTTILFPISPTRLLQMRDYNLNEVDGFYNLPIKESFLLSNLIGGDVILSSEKFR